MDLIEAAKAGDLQQVRALLANGADVNAREKRHPQGDTALIKAVNRNHVDMVRCLLEHGADIHLKDMIGRSALSWATFLGTPEMKQALLERHAAADPTQALLEAAGAGTAEVVRRALEQGSPADTRDRQERTPLMAAAAGGHEAIVRLLLDARADVNAVDSRGHTALMGAASSGWPGVVKLLLDRGADVNARVQDGSTALIGTVIEERPSDSRRPAVVELLIAHGADVNARNNSGWTALKWAVFNYDQAVVDLLLAAGAVEPP